MLKMLYVQLYPLYYSNTYNRFYGNNNMIYNDSSLMKEITKDCLQVFIKNIIACFLLPLYTG